jgi:hypothetical protein
LLSDPDNELDQGDSSLSYIDEEQEFKTYEDTSSTKIDRKVEVQEEHH